MTKIVKWTGIALGSVLVLAAVEVGVIYAASELVLRRTYDVPLTAFTASGAADAVEEGKRLATIRGCNDGCHGPGMEGQLFWDQPLVARLVAPDLTRVAADHTDAELERAIRAGVRKDGTSTWGMPSAAFRHLSDDDLAAIIAFMRSAPLSRGPDTEARIGLLGRIGVLSGKFAPQAQRIAQSTDAPPVPNGSTPEAFGHYLAVTICSECHGLDLGGFPGGAPHLAITAAYSEDDFLQLMRTGVALGGRNLGLMSGMSRRRFSHLTTDEMLAMYAYLRTLANRERWLYDQP
jgi:mono/diheme cytochrome c family protein